MSKTLLRMEPVFQEKIWGGNRLRTAFHYDTPSDHTGECWAVSGHPSGDCRLQNPEFAGETVGSLWKKRPDLFGHVSGDSFPLLVKIIDAKEDLSIQVHPDDHYAAEHENGARGKTECWYVLDCDPDATIVIGHNAKTRDELRQMVTEKRWGDLIRILPIKKGDFFQIEPGTVHAIRRGTLILETQQNSDITYRLYDYDRLQDGKPRELHIDKSLDVIRCPHRDVPVGGEQTEGDGFSRRCLISCPCYCVEKWDIRTSACLSQDYPFLIVDVLEGEGTADGNPIRKGDHFILPNGYGSCTLSGTLSLITSHVQA